MSVGGLKPKHLEAIVKVLEAHPRVERAVLFGSRATGGWKSTSDIDIALFGDSLTLGDQAGLAEAFEQMTMAQRVDLVRGSRIQSPELAEHIRRDGVVLLQRRSGERGETGREVNIDRRAGADKAR